MIFLDIPKISYNLYQEIYVVQGKIIGKPMAKKASNLKIHIKQTGNMWIPERFKVKRITT